MLTTQPTDGKVKAPPSAGRMWLVGLAFSGLQAMPLAVASCQIPNDFNVPSAIARFQRRPGYP